MTTLQKVDEEFLTQDSLVIILRSAKGDDHLVTFVEVSMGAAEADNCHHHPAIRRTFQTISVDNQAEYIVSLIESRVSQAVCPDNLQMG